MYSMACRRGSSAPITETMILSGRDEYRYVNTPKRSPTSLYHFREPITVNYSNLLQNKKAAVIGDS